MTYTPALDATRVPSSSLRATDLHLSRVCLTQARAARQAGYIEKAALYARWARNASRRAVRAKG